MMASSIETFIDIDLAKYTKSSMRARTSELINQVVAGSSMLARVGITIIDVEFTISTLVTFRTGALVGANQIFACGSILARVG